MSENVITILAQKGFKALRTRENEYASPCPFCGGKDRFVVWDDDFGGKYWCRRCKRSGTASWLAKALGIRPLEAIGSEKYILQPDKQKRPKVNRQRWRSQANAFLEWSQEQLELHTDTLRWLKKERGIKQKTARALGLGFNPQHQYFSRKKWGLPPAVNADGKQKKVFLPKGLVIPAFSKSGCLKRIRFRVFDCAQLPKYLLLAGSSTTPMLLGSRKSDSALVVESELDAILLHQEIPNILHVGLGSVAIRPSENLVNLLRRKRLLLSLDDDQAGLDGVRHYQELFAHAEYFPVIRGKDHTEAFLAGVDLHEWFLQGVRQIFGVF